MNVMRFPDQDKYRNKGARKAFTLIEILLVLALLTVISSIAFPSIARWQRSFELDQTAQQVCEFLQNSRLDAIGHALPVHVVVDLSVHELRRKQLWDSSRLEDQKAANKCKLPENFEFQMLFRHDDELVQCDSSLVFHANGTAANAKIAILDKRFGDVRLITTSRLTGTVRVVE